MDDLKKQLSQPSIESKQEWVGKLISYLAIILIGGLVGTILIFLTLKGIALFKDNGVSIWHFLTSTDW